MDRLKQVRDEVVGCTKCDLARTRRHSVPGSGNPHSDVVFIGEAPGRSEDRCGEPFVGAAGKILSEALEASGMPRESVYITNVVKCRPPDNRVPNCSERESCSEYLQREIQAIAPKIVCILGNTAFNSVLGGTGITKHRGKIIKKSSQLYFITVHPAAAIYRRELFGVLKSDIKRLFSAATELKNGGSVQVDVEYNS